MKKEDQSPLAKPAAISRRRMLTSTALGLAGASAIARPAQLLAAAAQGKAVRNGRIKQSIVHWCFEAFGEKWDLDKTARVARELGCTSVELIASGGYPILKKHGLTCAIAQINMDPDPPFLKGFNNPAHWPRVVAATMKAIDEAADFGAPNVICFTGYSARDLDNPQSEHISKEEGARNCVEGFKKVMGHAEKRKITLCLEMLNTREDTHPMKGHPGYQGDSSDYCVDIIKRVGSPRMKLLFDVYHAQIMDGDIIRRIRQHKEFIGHVHTAGNPGRNELDDKQEINYPPIMRALLEIGYTGFVGQEFIPTRDPYQGLREAVALCDV
jgi:hydroxypyruvate isomerase